MHVREMHWKCFPSTLHLVSSLSSKIYCLNHLVYVLWGYVCGQVEGIALEL